MATLVKKLKHRYNLKLRINLAHDSFEVFILFSCKTYTLLTRTKLPGSLETETFFLKTASFEDDKKTIYAEFSISTEEVGQLTVSNEHQLTISYQQRTLSM